MTQMPSPAVMRRAFAEKNPAFEGAFFVGVKTTGVFCRPLCAAKPARPENLEFFASAAEAMRNGYRACKLCKPMEPAGFPPAVVARISRLMRSEPGRRLTYRDLHGLGIDPSTARRQFRAFCGLSFAAYQRRLRLGLAAKEIRAGHSGAGAGAAAGFESNSGFRDAWNRLTESRPAQILTARWLATPLGNMIAAADEQGIKILEFMDRRNFESAVREIAAHWPRSRKSIAIVPGNHAHLDQLSDELAEYFSGVRTEFSVRLAPAGTAFQLRAWEFLKHIPFGQTRSYAEQARGIGQVRAVRAVARANATNRIAILIPCHRVIGSDGGLSGYAAGVARKRWLLNHERRAKR